MSPRPLVLVSGLTIGDYLLWNWSLNANHDALSLISGLTLPPLVIACLWLLAVSLARGLARTTRRPRSAASRGTARRDTAPSPTDAAGAIRAAARRSSTAAGEQPDPATVSATGVREMSAGEQTAGRSRKLAA